MWMFPKEEHSWKMAVVAVMLFQVGLVIAWYVGDWTSSCSLVYD
jgi:hypothetical protein